MFLLILENLPIKNLSKVSRYVIVLCLIMYHAHLSRINGVPACANKKLLTDILRGEWGFEGNNYIVHTQTLCRFIIDLTTYNVQVM